MKYAREERLEIGRLIYEGRLSKREAAKKYGIGEDRARDYMRMYRDEHALPPKDKLRYISCETPLEQTAACMQAYAGMSREELVRELVNLRIREARLKKGYMVKGVGANRQIIAFDSLNTK